jgi:hypothetical protein
MTCVLTELEDCRKLLLRHLSKARVVESRLESLPKRESQVLEHLPAELPAESHGPPLRSLDLGHQPVSLHAASSERQGLLDVVSGCLQQGCSRA